MRVREREGFRMIFRCLFGKIKWKVLLLIEIISLGGKVIFFEINNMFSFGNVVFEVFVEYLCGNKYLIGNWIYSFLV